ncbi:MAG: shikimate kinase [Clostridia bacterium]|nr:shikimate kinase [Clostridia bacterium]
MNIVLCGMMGVGKSSVGIRIAEITGRLWVDTDILITDRYGKISDLFEYYGEGHFRSLETEVVRELSKKDGLIISTGGGLVLKPENSELLKQGGKIFFMRASIETLLSRVRADESRPLLHNTEKTAETLGGLLSVRTPVYERVADHIVDTDGKTVEEVALEIVALVGNEI